MPDDALVAVGVIRLPVELLDAVLRELDDNLALLSARAVSKTCCYLATPRAFHTIQFRDTYEGAEGLLRISESEELVKHVKEIGFHFRARQGSLSDSVHDTYQDDVTEKLVEAFSALDRFKAFHTLGLTFYHDWDHLKAGCYKFTPLYDLRSTVHLSPLGRLVGVGTFNFNTYGKEVWDTLLSSLASISVSFVSETDPRDADLTPSTPPAVSRILPKAILASSQSSLTSLTIHSYQWGDSYPSLQLEDLTFPHLTSLSLKCIVFKGGRDIRYFILRHSSTIKTLRLISCLGCAYINRPVYRYPSQIGWWYLLDTLRSKMEALVEFEMIDDEEILRCHIIPGRRRRYNDEDDEVSTSSEHLESIRRSDLAAYEALLHSVEMRKLGNI